MIAEFGYCCGSVLCPLCARPVSTIASVMPSHMVRHVSVFHGVVTGVVTSVTFGLAWKSVMGVEVRINGNLCFLLLLCMLRDGIVGLCDYDSLVRLPIIVIIIIFNHPVAIILNFDSNIVIITMVVVLLI